MGAEVKLDPTPGKAGTSRRRHEQKREQASNTCNHLGWTCLAHCAIAAISNGSAWLRDTPPKLSFAFSKSSIFRGWPPLYTVARFGSLIYLGCSIN